MALKVLDDGTVVDDDEQPAPNDQGLQRAGPGAPSFMPGSPTYNGGPSGWGQPAPPPGDTTPRPYGARAGFGYAADRYAKGGYNDPALTPTPADTSPSLSVAGANADIAERLQAGNRPVPPAIPPKSAFENFLSILDRPSAFGRSAVSALMSGKDLGQAMSAGGTAFSGGPQTSPEDLVTQVGNKGIPFLSNLARTSQKTNIGKFFGEAAAAGVVDPTSFLSLGSKEVAKQGFESLAKGVSREAGKAGLNLADESLARLAGNAAKGETPIGRLGSVVEAARGNDVGVRQGSNKGFATLDAVARKTQLEQEAAYQTSRANDLVEQSKALKPTEAAPIDKSTWFDPRGTRQDYVATQTALHPADAHAILLAPKSAGITEEGVKAARALLDSQIAEATNRAMSAKEAASAVRPNIVPTTEYTSFPKPAGARQPTINFAGIPIANLPPIKTAAGALITRVPGATQVKDTLGRIFNFDYVPTSLTGIERAKVSQSLEDITAAGRQGPVEANRAIAQTMPEFAGTTTAARKEATGVIEKTAPEGSITAGAADAAATADAMQQRVVQMLSDAHINIDQIDNYITHAYADRPSVVQNALARWRASGLAGLRATSPNFLFNRLIPTVAEAQRYGLHPITDVGVLSAIHNAAAAQLVVHQRLAMDLARMGPEILSDTMRTTMDGRNFVPVPKTFPSLGGRFLHPEVAGKLATLDPIINNTDTGMRTIANLHKAAINAFKALALATPTFHLHNATGNIWLLAGDGVINPDRYAQAMAVMKGWLPSVELGGKTYDVAGLTKAFENMGLPGQGGYHTVVKEGPLIQRSEEAFAAADRSAVANAAQYANPIKAAGGVINASRSLGEATDTYFRWVGFLHHLDQGLSIPQAADAVRRALFDYSRLTPAELQYGKAIIPFYAWIRNSLPKMAELMIGTPGLFTGTVHVRDAAFNANGIDRTHLPGWMNDNMAIPLWVDPDGNVHYITTSLPMIDLAKIHDPRDVRAWGLELLSSTDPYAAAAASLAFNKDTLGRDITKTPDMPLDAATLADYGRYLIAQFGGIGGRVLTNPAASDALANKRAVQAAGGKTADVPPPVQNIPGIPMTVRNPQNDANAALYDWNNRLKQAETRASLEGVVLPTTKQLRDAEKPKGFAAAVAGVQTPDANTKTPSQGSGFGAVVNTPRVATAPVPTILDQAVRQSGVDQTWATGLANLLKRENGRGNVTAINPTPVLNTWTRPGAPFYEHATGLFQMLPSTFKANAAPGHTDINNPLDNTLAAIHYIQARYRHPANIPNVANFQPGVYKGY